MSPHQVPVVRVTRMAVVHLPCRAPVVVVVVVVAGMRSSFGYRRPLDHDQDRERVRGLAQCPGQGARSPYGSPACASPRTVQLGLILVLGCAAQECEKATA